MKTIKAMWEDRSRKFGSRIEGVLPKSWPRSLNLYLDRWMYRSISKQIPRNGRIRVLDLGCGYGRLAGKVLNDYPKAMVLGIDISKNYVNFFNKTLSPRGKAIVGDIKKLPYKNNHFNVVYMVTTLMYLVDHEDQGKAVGEIFRVLKKGGRFVFIERNPLGHNIVNLFGLVQLLRGETKKEIHSVNFDKDQLCSLVRSKGGKIEKLESMPFFTLSFYLLFILSKLKMEKLPLYLIEKIDSWVGQNLLTLSLYISYSGKKL